MKKRCWSWCKDNRQPHYVSSPRKNSTVVGKHEFHDHACIVIPTRNAFLACPERSRGEESPAVFQSLWAARHTFSTQQGFLHFVFGMTSNRLFPQPLSAVR